MISSRYPDGAAGGVRAAGALGALVVLVPASALADGERTPMLGAAVVAAHAPEQDAELLGVALEAAWWLGRVGVAAEGSMRWALDEGPRVAVLGASARVRVIETLLPALLDARDVELGIELHGIVEHAWWDGEDATGYGLGLAARVRGGEDDDSSTLLAESRLFVRMVSSRWDELQSVARTTTPPLESREPRVLTVLIGLGASFGRGDPGYVTRFHAQPFDALR